MPSEKSVDSVVNKMFRKIILPVAFITTLATAAATVSIPISAEAAAPPPGGKKLDERVTDYNTSISYTHTTGGINDPSLPEGVTEIPPLEATANNLVAIGYTGLVVHWGPSDKGGNGRYLGFYPAPLGDLSGAIRNFAAENTKREHTDTDESYGAKVNAMVKELASNADFMADAKRQLGPQILESIRKGPFGMDITVRVIYPSLAAETLDDAAYQFPSATYEFVVPTGTLKEASLSLKSIGPVTPGAEVGIYLEKVGVADSRREVAHLVVSNPGSADPQTLSLPNLGAGTYHVTIQHLPSSQYPSNLLLEELGITGKIHEPTGRK